MNHLFMGLAEMVVVVVVVGAGIVLGHLLSGDFFFHILF